MKVCKVCGEDNPENFSQTQARLLCKVHLRDYFKENNRRNREYFKAYWKKWYSSHKKEHSLNARKFARAWMMKNKEKANAHSKLYYAVKTGKINKPLHCSSCSSQGKIEGHHPDYQKPLQVVWLCRSCHKSIHRHSLTPLAKYLGPLRY